MLWEVGLFILKCLSRGAWPCAVSAERIESCKPMHDEKCAAGTEPANPYLSQVCADKTPTGADTGLTTPKPPGISFSSKWSWHFATRFGYNYRLLANNLRVSGLAVGYSGRIQAETQGTRNLWNQESAA